MQRLSTQVASHKKVWEGETSPSVHAVITAIFKRITNDKSYESRANEKCIDAQNWNLFLNSQRRLIAKNPTLYFQDDPDEASEFLKITEDLNVSTSQEALRNGAEFVFKAVMKRADESLKGLILVNTLLRNANNVSSPMHWYPLARMMKRKIIYHGGPTNSGKVRLQSHYYWFSYLKRCKLYRHIMRLSGSKLLILALAVDCIAVRFVCWPLKCMRG